MARLKGRLLREGWDKLKEKVEEITDNNSLEDVGDSGVEAPEVDSDGSILDSVAEFLGDLLS